MTEQLPGPRNWLQRAALAVGAVATLAVTLAISVVLFSVLLVVGAVGFAVVWWKTRELRATMRQAEAELRERFEQQRRAQGTGSAEPRGQGGDVLEGEYVVVEEHRRGPSDPSEH